MAEAKAWGWRVLIKPLLTIAGLAAAGFAFRALHIHDFAAQAGGLSLGGFVLLGALACAVGVPRQIVAFAGGYAHGLWLGGALALAAQVLGCLADLVWARAIAGGWVRARLRGRFGARLQRLDDFLRDSPFGATLVLRLLPVGNNLFLNLVAGGFGVPVGGFIAGSAVGYLPQTLVFVLLGTGVQVAHGTEVAVALLAFAASSLLGLWLMRRNRGAAGAVRPGTG